MSGPGDPPPPDPDIFVLIRFGINENYRSRTQALWAAVDPEQENKKLSFSQPINIADDEDRWGLAQPSRLLYDPFRNEIICAITDNQSSNNYEYKFLMWRIGPHFAISSSEEALFPNDNRSSEKFNQEVSIFTDANKAPSFLAGRRVYGSVWDQVLFRMNKDSGKKDNGKGLIVPKFASSNDEEASKQDSSALCQPMLGKESGNQYLFLLRWRPYGNNPFLYLDQIRTMDYYEAEHEKKMIWKGFRIQVGYFFAGTPVTTYIPGTGPRDPGRLYFIGITKPSGSDPTMIQYSWIPLRKDGSVGLYDDHIDARDLKRLPIPEFVDGSSTDLHIAETTNHIFLFWNDKNSKSIRAYVGRKDTMNTLGPTEQWKPVELAMPNDSRLNYDCKFHATVVPKSFI